jgi:kynurenine formamidase
MGQTRRDRRQRRPNRLRLVGNDELHPSQPVHHDEDPPLCNQADNDIRFRRGDILFLRTGFTPAYDKLSSDEELAISQRETPQFAGLEAGEATLRWLWENQFAAVASDSPSFEPSPIAGPDGPPEFQLHQWLLAGWGMPIGEYFDLEGVAEYCAKMKRWSFFLSSVPLKVSQCDAVLFTCW